MLTHMRALLVSIGGLLALGLVACSGGSSLEATGPSVAATSATTFPPSGTYIADITRDGRAMSIGISVDGSDIAAYACNGSDDEAWFFGSQSSGRIDIDSRFRDTLEATFDGTDVEGELTVNGVAYPFIAPPAQAPAGVYTADTGGVRSTWVRRPDESAIGVQYSGGVSDHDLEQADGQRLAAEQFRTQVRSRRQLQQAAQLVVMRNGAMGSTINGRAVTPTLVSGSFRLG
ncbi:hypothetical protein O6P37_17865 [Mycobacterium sp. CPCC 205372]|uniref:Uncharacterized protein n=1 Tax=Mycobacterium hippophais TaxID=3016340 RepID=A0ABT4PVX4_9MYCO|nr:hypothetical protein [Mycobacterium hippophais]MCZ8380738.1 hypothetical protein [Mycobacterium hippophais]